MWMWRKNDNIYDYHHFVSRRRRHCTINKLHNAINAIPLNGKSFHFVSCTLSNANVHSSNVTAKINSEEVFHSKALFHWKEVFFSIRRVRMGWKVWTPCWMAETHWNLIKKFAILFGTKWKAKWWISIMQNWRWSGNYAANDAKHEKKSFAAQFFFILSNEITRYVDRFVLFSSFVLFSREKEKRH